MSYETDLKTALAPLCALAPLYGVSARSYWTDTFPQKGQPNQWPAIRVTTVSAVPENTICGSGADPETDFHVQIDGVAADSDARDALRLAIQAAMQTFPTPNLCEGWDKSFDTDARAFRIRLDYVLLPSS